ncbi:MAG: hypothetical protein ACREP9_10440 [Candidatus Dormibacteraceae bacterium]
MALHFWNTRAGGEVDFLAGTRSEFDVVECKYQAHVSRSLFNGLRVAFSGRPLVAATRDQLEWGDGWAMIPLTSSAGRWGIDLGISKLHHIIRATAARRPARRMAQALAGLGRSPTPTSMRWLASRAAPDW